MATPVRTEEQPLMKIKRKKPVTLKAVRQLFNITAHLSNLLPTGSVLAFQTLVPIFTRQGTCQAQVCRALTSILLTLCAISCFVLCFTDSFRDKKGKVRYGIATFSGLWVFDGSNRVVPEKPGEFKMRFIDVFHGFLSVAVFGSIAVFDKNVVSCFYPKASENMGDLLSVMPMGVGVLCSVLFGAFPSRRHGIGFPLSEN